MFPPPQEEGSEVFPRPMECLVRGSPMVPPFLSKTYDLVDEAGLDAVLSWGKTGESFVVWDPVQFSRSVLPRHFKHNNFSSFVRQLNTYGFRKIDTDKWEFANESFRRGQKHLLKNIQRRKAPQSQLAGVQAGPYLEAGLSGLEVEVESLTRDRRLMMEDVVELRQQHRGTVQHVGEVNRRLGAAEQKQKQMLSFLSKLFQNQEFLARLRQQKEQGHIGSPRMKRRFVSHQAHAAGQIGPSLEEQIVKYGPESLKPEADSVHIDPNELAKAQGLNCPPVQAGEETLSLGIEDWHFKGNSIATPEKGIGTEYSLSYLDEFEGKEEFLEFPSSGLESMAKQEDLWNLEFDAQTGMSSSTSDLWGSPVNYNVPEFGLTAFSDIWDTGSDQEAGGSGITLWSAEELEGRARPPIDDRTMNKNP